MGLGLSPAHPGSPLMPQGCGPGGLTSDGGQGGREAALCPTLPLLAWAEQEAEGRDSQDPGLKGCRAACGGVGEPPPALSRPVGEAQLLWWLTTRVSGQDTPTGCCCGDGPAFLPPPPWLLESWAREAGVCPTQALQHTLGTQAGDQSPSQPHPSLVSHVTWRAWVGASSPHPCGPLGARGLHGRDSSPLPLLPRPVPTEPAGRCPLRAAMGLGGSPGRAVAPSSYKNKSTRGCRHGRDAVWRSRPSPRTVQFSEEAPGVWLGSGGPRIPAAGQWGLPLTAGPPVTLSSGPSEGQPRPGWCCTGGLFCPGYLPSSSKTSRRGCWPTAWVGPGHRVMASLPGSRWLFLGLAGLFWYGLGPWVPTYEMDPWWGFVGRETLLPLSFKWGHKLGPRSQGWG